MKTTEDLPKSFKLTRHLVSLDARTPFAVLRPDFFLDHEEFLTLLRDELVDTEVFETVFLPVFQRFTMNEEGLYSLEYRLTWTVRGTRPRGYDTVEKAVKFLVRAILRPWKVMFQNPDRMGLWPIGIEPLDGVTPAGINIRLIDPVFAKCSPNARAVLIDMARIRMMRAGVFA